VWSLGESAAGNAPPAGGHGGPPYGDFENGGFCRVGHCADPENGSVVFQPVAKKGGFKMDVKKIRELFSKELVVINMGLESFADNLRKEDVKVLPMDWKPPAGGNKRLIALLEKLGR
jgi:hypothetical protein